MPTNSVSPESFSMSPGAVSGIPIDEVVKPNYSRDRQKGHRGGRATVRLKLIQASLRKIKDSRICVLNVGLFYAHAVLFRRRDFTSMPHSITIASIYPSDCYVSQRVATTYRILFQASHAAARYDGSCGHQGRIRLRFNILMTLLIGGALAVFIGCGSDARPAEPTRIAVTVLKVSEGQESNSGAYTASFQPHRQTALSFQVGGYVDFIKQVPGADGRMRALEEAIRSRSASPSRPSSQTRIKPR